MDKVMITIIGIPLIILSLILLGEIVGKPWLYWLEYRR
jgi:hypothetical protein